MAYLLCASPRSGSTLLCDLLWQTRVAGKPDSFFRPASIPDFAQDFGLPHVDADTYGGSYIAAAIAEGTQATGTFGLRTMWDSLPGLVERLRALHGPATDTGALTRAFGQCAFIYLSRDDKVAQAVSLAIAEQTGLWHSNADGTDRENFNLAERAAYDAAQIGREVAGLQAEMAGWTGWFAANGITPLRVTYESLAADPLGELKRVLRFLGFDPASAGNLLPGTRKLADRTNRDWAARFRRDHGLPPASVLVAAEDSR